jgi:putative two-component system response regulator
MLLEASGYLVVMCGNAQEAIEKFQTTNIDVVLSDIRMAGLSGIELAGKIHEMNSEVPVILMTAYAEVDIAVDAIHKGASEFITKPFKPEYLISSVGKAVRYREMILLEKNYKQKLEEEVSRDASHLKKAGQEMRKLSLAVQGTSDWVLITDRTGAIEYVNRAVEEISGFGREEIIGQKPSIFRSASPAVRTAPS